MGDVTITGLEQLDALASRFEVAGLGGLRHNLEAALAEAGPHVRDPLADDLRRRLPHSGGLADLAAQVDVNVTPGGAGETVGIEIGLDAPVNLQALDEGHVTHPTFGHDPTVTQDVPSGVVSDSLQSQEHTFATAVERGLDATGDYLQGRH